MAVRELDRSAELRVGAAFAERLRRRQPSECGARIAAENKILASLIIEKF
jgi:hypothetical protein